MQPFERYAAVALLFLVALVAVVWLWDDGSTDDSTSDETTVAQIERQQESGTPAPTAASRGGAAPAAKPDRRGPASASSMPISGQDERKRDLARASTRRTNERHGVDPIRRVQPEEERPRATPAPAQSKEELSSLQQTVPIYGARKDEGRLAIQDGSFLTSRRKTEVDPARETSSSRGVKDAVARDRVVAKTRAANSTESRKSTSAKQPKAKSSKTRTYTVKSGDALSKIAKRELGREGAWREIASLNGLAEPYKIFENMELKLPVQVASATSATTASSAKAKAAAPSRALASGQRAYVMAKGETLSTVLERELGTYKRAIALVSDLNPGLNPDRVRAGQTVVLPNRSAIPAASTTSKPAKRGPSRKASSPTLSASSRGERVAAAAPSKESEFVVR